MHMYFIFIILLKNYEKDVHRTCTHVHTIIGSPGRKCVLIILFQLYGSKTGFLKVIYSGQVNMTPPPSHPSPNLHIGRRTNPILSNLSNNSKSENADIMLQMLTSFFVASKGKKFLKINENVKIEQVKILHIF